MNKQLVALGLMAGLSVAGSMAVFAGQWKQTDNQWKYQNDDGGYAVGWQWLDGNRDGTAECYYLDTAGVMLSNTTTPDGYTVNQDGAWVVDNTIQTKSMSSNNGRSNGESNLAKWDGHFFRSAYGNISTPDGDGPIPYTSTLEISLVGDGLQVERFYIDTGTHTEQVTLTFSNEEKTQAHRLITNSEHNSIYLADEVYTLKEDGVEISYVPVVDSVNQAYISYFIQSESKLHAGLYLGQKDDGR